MNSLRLTFRSSAGPAVVGASPCGRSGAWLVRARVRELRLNPPVRMNLPGFRLCFAGKGPEDSCEPGGLGVVRGLSRGPAVFRVGLWGGGGC